MSIYSSDSFGSPSSSYPIFIVDLDLPTTTLGSVIELIRKTPNENIDIVCCCAQPHFAKFEYIVDYLKECGKGIRMFYRGDPKLRTDSTDTFKFHVKLKYYTQQDIDKYKLVGY